MVCWGFRRPTLHIPAGSIKRSSTKVFLLFKPDVGGCPSNHSHHFQLDAFVVPCSGCDVREGPYHSFIVRDSVCVRHLSTTSSEHTIQTFGSYSSCTLRDVADLSASMSSDAERLPIKSGNWIDKCQDQWWVHVHNIPSGMQPSLILINQL